MQHPPIGATDWESLVLWLLSNKFDFVPVLHEVEMRHEFMHDELRLDLRLIRAPNHGSFVVAGKLFPSKEARMLGKDKKFAVLNQSNQDGYATREEAVQAASAMTQRHETPFVVAVVVAEVRPKMNVDVVEFDK